MSQDHLIEQLHGRFGGSVPLTTLRHDVEPFLDKLSQEGIIKKIESS